jgi:hypothetical protein
MKVETVTDGEWFVMPDYHVCCKCGLTHRVRIRVRKGRIEWQFKRVKGKR